MRDNIENISSCLLFNGLIIIGLLSFIFMYHLKNENNIQEKLKLQAEKIEILERKNNNLNLKLKQDSSRKQLQIIFEFLPDYEIGSKEREVGEKLFHEMVMDQVRREKRIEEEYNN